MEERRRLFGPVRAQDFREVVEMHRKIREAEEAAQRRTEAPPEKPYPTRKVTQAKVRRNRERNKAAKRSRKRNR